MKKRNWTNWVITLTIIGIVAVCCVFITHNKRIINEEIKAASESTSNTRESFEIWSLEGGMLDVLEEVIPKYKKLYPTINFKIKIYKPDIYMDLVSQAARTNGLPDMFYSWGGEQLFEIIRFGVIQDISKEVDSVLGDELSEGCLENYDFNNRIFGLPVFGWSSVLYCNTEIFEKYGLEYPKTYDEFIQVVETFKEAGVTPLANSGNESWMPSLYFMEIALKNEDMQFIKGLGQNTLYFGRDGFVKAAKEYKELIDLKPWQQGYENISGEDAVNVFSKGNSAMLLSGSWSSTKLDDTILSKIKGKVKVIHFPRYNSRTLGMGGNADGFALSKKNSSLSKEERNTLFINLAKDISDRCVMNKGMGLPVYRDQSLEGTKFTLLKQCQALFPSIDYHIAYDKMFNQDMAREYNYAICEFVKGEVEAQQFINMIKNYNVGEAYLLE